MRHGNQPQSRKGGRFFTLRHRCDQLVQVTKELEPSGPKSQETVQHLYILISLEISKKNEIVAIFMWGKKTKKPMLLW